MSFRVGCVEATRPQRHVGLFVKEAPAYYNRVPLKILMGFATQYSFNSFGNPDPLAGID